MAVEPITTEELVARLAAVEQAQAAKQAAETVDLHRLNMPRAPAVRTWFANAQDERQARARLARLQARKAEAEAQRKQAEKDAPKQAKRDKEIAATNEQIDTKNATIAEETEKRDRLIADRQRLQRLPL
jgi:predicted RNase H-like nuclease (RuvC/YqgF family)